MIKEFITTGIVLRWQGRALYLTPVSHSTLLYKIPLDKTLPLSTKTSMHDLKSGHRSPKKGSLNIGLFSKIFTIVDLRGKNRSFLFCLLVLFFVKNFSIIEIKTICLICIVLTNYYWIAHIYMIDNDFISFQK